MASQKREQLLSTAERLFYEEGFHATGIDRIVAAAGVVRMTLYNHFPSKDALVAAVLKRRHERFLASLDTAHRAAASGTATLSLVDAHSTWLTAHSRRGCFLIKMMGEYAEHSPEIYKQARAAKQDLRTRIRDALAKDGLGDAAGLEDRIFLVLEGCHAAELTLGAEAAVRAARHTVETLLAEAGSGSP